MDDSLMQRLLDCEGKVALQDEVLDVIEQALELIPTGQLASGFTWMPSPEAVVIIKIAKDRLKEHKELRAVLFER